MSNAIIVRPLAITTASASSTAAGYDPLNATAMPGADYLGVVWQSATGASSRTFTIDLGADQVCDFVALLGCTGALSGWTLKVEAATAAQGNSFASTVYSGTVDPFLAGATALPSGRGVGWWSNGSTVTARHWRFTIAGLGTAAVTIGRVVIGQKINLARNFSFGGVLAVRDQSSFDLSARAVPLWRRAAKLRTLGINFDNVHKDEIETSIAPLLAAHGNELPLFICTDPATDVLRQTRCFYGPLVGDLGMIWARANGWRWSANLISFI